MLARTSMVNAHLAARTFATSARSNVHVTVLGATGGIGQPCQSSSSSSLLCAALPAKSSLAPAEMKRPAAGQEEAASTLETCHHR